MLRALSWARQGSRTRSAAFVPRLLLFISGRFAFIFGQSWQAAHQPAEGWVMEKWEGGGFL